VSQKKFLNKMVCKECGNEVTTDMYLYPNQVDSYDEELSDAGWWRRHDCRGCEGELRNHTFYLTPWGCLRVSENDG